MQSPTYQYRGDLAQRSLPEILFTIYQHGVPGVIQVARGGVVKRLYVRNGRIVHASSSDLSDSLGAHLVQSGWLSSQDYQRVRRCDVIGARRMGERLIEARLLSPLQLANRLKQQIESIVWSVFSWDHGEVVFSIGEFDQPVPSSIELPVRRAIKEGVRSHPRPLDLIARIGGDEVLKPKWQAEDLIEIGLDEKEFQLLRRVDGQQSLRALCRDGPFAPVDNARLLYAFYVLGLARRARPALRAVHGKRRALAGSRDVDHAPQPGPVRLAPANGAAREA